MTEIKDKATYHKYWDFRYQENGIRTVGNLKMDVHSFALETVRMGEYLRRWVDCKGTLLDYGCSVGRFYPYLSDNCLRYIGLDISNEAIKCSRFLYPKGQFEDFEPDKDWPVVDSSVDTFMSIFVLQHVVLGELMDKFVANFKRCTKVGTRVFLVENCHKKPDADHIKFRKPEFYVNLLGLSEVSIRLENYSGEQHAQIAGKVT